MASVSVWKQNDIALLKTKLFIPPLQPRIVPNHRLIEKIRQGTLGKLTLVSAPAGFGKTTLVCQWINQQKKPVAWYSLDESDNEPGVFYRYLLTSLQNLDSSLKTAFDPLFQGRKVVGKTIINEIINHLSNLPGKFHLVLDDFHVIQSSSIHYDIQYLLRNSPPQLHLTIITRQDPPFQLSRFRARQEMVELKTPELKFSEHETIQFFQETMKIDLSLEQIRDLHSLTEGWIIGLQVIGLSLQKSNDPKRLTASGVAQNKYLLDYLFEEVFESQPPEVQDFLLKTSILKQLSIDLCNHMTGANYTFNMLEELEHKNLFIISLDDILKWYRYHSLFALMLQRRLQSSGNHSLADLHKKASAWYAEHGYLAEAFQHAFSSNDLEFAAELLENKFVTLIDNYEWATARRWLESLPDEIVQQRFLLLLYRALVIFLQEELNNIDTMIAELEKAFVDRTYMYSMEKKKHAEDLFLALKINCFHYKDSAKVIAVEERALQTISTKNVMALGLVQAVLSTAYIQQGDLQPAMDIVRSGLKIFTHSNPRENRYIKVHLLNKQARLEFLFGHLTIAEKLLDDALAYARQEDPPLRSAMAMLNITLAQIYYSQNRLDESMVHATRCIEYAKPVSDIGYLLLGLKLQAFMNEIFYNSNLANEIMNEALQIAGQTKSPVRIASTKLAAVELSIMQSELDTVSRWVAERKLSAAEPFSRNFEKECLLMARFAMATHKYKEAVDMLYALRPRVSKRKRLNSLLTIDVLIAACLYALDEKEKALNILEQCVEFAGPEGYIRPFVEITDYLMEMLFSLRKSLNGVVRIHVSKLLKACELQSEFSIRPVANGNVEKLSQREIEVIRLVFAGMTNKEITEQLFISLNTVKTHIKNIYGKFGVTAREQAILKARELNYI